MSPSNEKESVISIAQDDTDELLYCARAGELDDLKVAANAASSAHNISLCAVITSAVDENTGNTCLHYASANGHTEIVTYLISLAGEQPDGLIEKANSAGNTALHYAALNGHLNVAKQLVLAVPENERSAFVSQRNHAGHDAAYEAEGNEKEDVVNYLLEIMDDADATAAGCKDVVANEDDGEGSDDDMGEPSEDLAKLSVKNGEE